MKKIISLIALVLICMFVLVSCGKKPIEVPVDPIPTPTDIATPTDATPTDIATPTDVATPSDVATSTGAE